MDLYRGDVDEASWILLFGGSGLRGLKNDYEGNNYISGSCFLCYLF